MAANATTRPSEEDFKLLKERCQMIFDADPSQYHNDASLHRFHKAFLGVDETFQAVLKCNKWRREFGVANLSPEDPDILEELQTMKALILSRRDARERPIIYIAVKKHNANDRDLDKLTKFIVYLLETACRKCNEEIIDNICVVFDMKDFTMQCMDYQFVKTLIWLLSKYFPERLGVCLIINAPMLFYGCWTVIQPWLNEKTASKVVFVNDDQALSEYLCPDALPHDL
ncbi:CRAL-TRIO domain-containing protein C3H8.02-like [Lingula anatina]|uniref:CRAL-TRIO domain-containing protein C3H8.02-like n=1 Tax=Lingula anatina TaxID=7574 RepID=A0A1S3KEN7_LINAN|nr:CRAL-TRIO domain-containing protein C3H8.02-like [Lingula anatina]|eukprot:XP_013421088.1 CRAL-TRIO domain-containing protein C3H8.02-like [Lingula anatina]